MMSGVTLRVARASTSRMLANLLRDELLSGALPPGAPLRDTELAERANVSRGTAREALAELARGGFGHHDEGDLSRLEALHALAARQDAALRRENAGDANEVAGGDACGAERQLERGELLAVFPDSFGEEHLLRHETDHAHAPCVAADPAW